MENTIILEIQNLTKSFGKFIALKNISFQIERGKIVGLLGRNGAGKTTLIKTILGLYKNFDGEIDFDGKKMNHNDPIVMNQIGSLVDTVFHEDLSAYDNLLLLMMATPEINTQDCKKKIYELLEFVGLGEEAKHKVKSFSFGMKQRLALSQALIADTKLLILDEPFVGLDPLGIELVKDKLRQLCRERGVSIIFSSHQLSEVAELSDELVVIANGELKYCGSYHELSQANKKYVITVDKELNHLPGLICSTENNILRVNHSDRNLNEAIKALVESHYIIEQIDIEENSLLKLFCE